MITFILTCVRTDRKWMFSEQGLAETYATEEANDGRGLYDWCVVPYVLNSGDPI